MTHTRFSSAIQLACACMLAWPVLTGCQRGSSGALPGEFLGEWHHAGTSGGMDGRSGADDSTGHVVFRGDNTMDVFDKRRVILRKVAFTVGRGKSSFSGQNAWIVGFDGGGQEVIRLSDDGRGLSLRGNHVEGFSRHFRRSP